MDHYQAFGQPGVQADVLGTQFAFSQVRLASKRVVQVGVIADAPANRMTGSSELALANGIRLFGLAATIDVSPLVRQPASLKSLKKTGSDS